MLRKPLFWDLFWLIVLIASLHMIGAYFYIYWIVPQYDILMHFLGGFWIGLVSLWIYFVAEYISVFKKDSRSMFFAALITVLAIGMAWEVFEFLIGLTTSEYADKIDTLSDLTMDVIGGVSAYTYFKYRTKK